MPDVAIYNPADYASEDLRRAARGELVNMPPQLAVILLREKLGEKALPELIVLALDDTVDPRARHAATLALGSFPSAQEAQGALASLKDSPIRLVADAALAGLQREIPPIQ